MAGGLGTRPTRSDPQPALGLPARGRGEGRLSQFSGPHSDYRTAPRESRRGSFRQQPDRKDVVSADLPLSLPSDYLLAAEGKDVYRNFLVPIPTIGRRYVRAVEFHPGNN